MIHGPAWKTLGSWLSRGIKYFRIIKTLFAYSSDRRNLEYLVLFLSEKDNDLTMEFIMELQFFWKELSPGLRKWVFRKTTFLPLTFTCKVALLFSGWLTKQRSADNRPSSHHIRQATWLLYYLLWVGCWMLMLEIVIEANKAKKEDYESWIKWHGGQLLKPSALRIQQRSSYWLTRILTRRDLVRRATLTCCRLPTPLMSSGASNRPNWSSRITSTERSSSCSVWPRFSICPCSKLLRMLPSDFLFGNLGLIWK